MEAAAARQCSRCRRAFHADVGDEAGEQGAVDLFVARFFEARIGRGVASYPVVLFEFGGWVLVARVFQTT